MLGDSKKKYTKEQKRKAKYIQDHDAEKAGAQHKVAQTAWATVNKLSGGGELAASGTTTSEKATARKDSGKQAVKTNYAQSKPNALEQQSTDALRKKARKKQISGSSAMTKAELILALTRG